MPWRLLLLVILLLLWAPVHIGSGAAIGVEHPFLAVVAITFGVGLVACAFLIIRRKEAVRSLLPLFLAISAAVSGWYVAASLTHALGTGRLLYTMAVATFPPLLLAFVSILVFRSEVARDYFAKAR